MKQKVSLILWLITGSTLFCLTGCSNNIVTPTPVTPVVTATPILVASATPTIADHTAPGVSFTSAPNPIKVCDGSGLGTTSFDWRAPGLSQVEIHVNTPDGPLLARGHAEGKGQTRKWVTDGMVFYLQDMTGTDKTPAQQTIGTVTVHLTTTGCP